MLTFNLKKEWFEKIKSGEKTHEYREVKPYWIKRLNNNKSSKILFCDGYPKADEKEKRLYAKIKNIDIVWGKNTDLKIQRSVFDIEFELIKDNQCKTS